MRHEFTTETAGNFELICEYRGPQEVGLFDLGSLSLATRQKNKKAGLSPGLPAMRTKRLVILPRSCAGYQEPSADAAPQTYAIATHTEQLHFCIVIDGATVAYAQRPASHQYWGQGTIGWGLSSHL